MRSHVARQLTRLTLLAVIVGSGIAGVTFAQDDADLRIIEGKVDPYGFQPANDFVVVDPQTADLARFFEDAGPIARTWYQHVMTLSSPYFEGRSPGGDGIERAADYVEFWFDRAGLEPAFPDPPKASGGGCCVVG